MRWTNCQNKNLKNQFENYQRGCDGVFIPSILSAKRWKIPTLILFHRAQNHLNYLGSGLNPLKQQNSTRNFCGLANFQISKYFLKKNVYRRWNQELHLGRSWWAQAPERTSRRCLDCYPWQGVQRNKISGRGKIISPLRERSLNFTISLLLPNICCFQRKDLELRHAIPL